MVSPHALVSLCACVLFTIMFPLSRWYSLLKLSPVFLLVYHSSLVHPFRAIGYLFLPVFLQHWCVLTFISYAWLLSGTFLVASELDSKAEDKSALTLSTFSRVLYSFCRAAVRKYHRLYALNNRNMFFQSEGLKSETQGVGEVGFFWGLSTWLVDGYLLTVSSLCTYLCSNPLF